MHLNETVQSIIYSMNGKELWIINVKIAYNKEADKHKENSSTCDNKGEEKTLSTFEKKENYVMVMFVCMNASKTYIIQHVNARAKHRKNHQ